MAIVVSQFPRRELAQRGGGFRIYPWEQWTDGRVWQAKKGEDFYHTTKGFRSYLYIVSRNLGLSVRTTADGDVVTFQFSPKD